MPKTQQSAFTLKTLDGPLLVTFIPLLTIAQHVKLLADTTQSHTMRMYALAEYVQAMAHSWGREPVLDPRPPFPSPKSEE